MIYVIYDFLTSIFSIYFIIAGAACVCVCVSSVVVLLVTGSIFLFVWLVLAGICFIVLFGLVDMCVATPCMRVLILRNERTREKDRHQSKL